MKQSVFSSLRVRLLLLFVLIALPTFLFILSNATGAERQPASNPISLGILTVLVLAIAWVAGDALILRPVNMQRSHEPQSASPERTHADEALRASEERFRIAAQSASDLIWEWDIVNGKLEWFGAIDALLGYAPGEFPRTIEVWEGIIHPDDHDRVIAALDQHLKTRAPCIEEYRVRPMPNGWIFWRHSAVRSRLP